LDDVTSAMEGVRIGVALLGESIGLINKTKELLPDSDEKVAIETCLKEAGKAAQLAESQIALALGYKLCQCTFPPQIMLSQGYKEQNYSHKEEFACPKCKKSSIEPPSKPINYKSEF
jgi:hypothetical protein